MSWGRVERYAVGCGITEMEPLRTLPSPAADSCSITSAVFVSGDDMLMMLVETRYNDIDENYHQLASYNLSTRAMGCGKQGGEDLEPRLWIVCSSRGICAHKHRMAMLLDKAAVEDRVEAEWVEDTERKPM